ncbi:hypothetical protein ACK8HY_13610 [Sphingobacterium sp. NGMCC 1.201703]|uniref:hypothetical protein n=1 Tax=Sphingobacterium sp. NGMCC 1.201703 TaxID=3388657 RepID=UPI0039FCB838
MSSALSPTARYWQGIDHLQYPIAICKDRQTLLYHQNSGGTAVADATAGVLAVTLAATSIASTAIAATVLLALRLLSPLLL